MASVTPERYAVLRVARQHASVVGYPLRYDPLADRVSSAVRTPLSDRARSYLAQLRRHPQVPVARLGDSLRRQGVPTNDAWLDFHSRFAGYEERLGHDLAVWGLAHTHADWQDTNEVWIEPQGDRWRIACADVHPSYDFRLTWDGEFRSLGIHCESFDVHVEQLAAVWETARGRTWKVDLRLAADKQRRDELREKLQAERVAEASDRYGTVWRTSDLIILEWEKAALVWIATGIADATK